MHQNNICEQEQRTTLVQLTSIKGILCFVICMFMHYGWLMTGGYDIPFPIGGRLSRFLYTYGYYAVEMFFLISGFLFVYNGKEKAWEKMEDETDYNVFWFIYEKMAKQYPLLLVTLFATAITEVVFYAKHGMWFYVQDMSLTAWVSSILNFSSGWFWVDKNINMPVWYVSTLMLCQCIYYYIFRISRKRKHLFVDLSVLMVVLGITLYLRNGGAFAYENSARAYYGFFGGGLLAEAYQRTNVQTRRKTGNYALLFLALVGGLCVQFDVSTVLGAHKQLMWGTVISPLIIWVALNNEFVGRILSIKPLVQLGQISSHVYFWHFPCYCIIRMVSIDNNLISYYGTKGCWFMTAAIMLGVGLLSKTFFTRKHSKTSAA